MAKNKTTQNDNSVEAFLNSIADEQRRQDCFTVLEMMQKITKTEPKMWGDSIVGFGIYEYQYKSGRAGEIFKTGFSPRKQKLTLYIVPGFENYDELMSKLGKYKTGKSCLYLNKLSDIDLKTLKQLITHSVKLLSRKKK